MQFAGICIFVLLCQVCSSQAKFDTLFIAGKKYPLQRVAVYNSWFTENIGILPCEYKDLFNYSNWRQETPQFKFHGYTDSTYIIANDDNGTEITSLIYRSCKPDTDQVYYLTCLLDTITIPYTGFGEEKPYIKSQEQKLYFTGAVVDAFYNSRILKYVYAYMLAGNIFSYWGHPFDPEEKIKIRKGTTFILRDLTYRKDNATYYLDRKFVIKLK